MFSIVVVFLESSGGGGTLRVNFHTHTVLSLKKMGSVMDLFFVAGIPLLNWYSKIIIGSSPTVQALH